MIRVDDYDFDLPEELIAQTPLKERDKSRLMVVDKKGSEPKDYVFSDLVDLLDEGDILVFNDSRVIPARLFGHRKDKEEKVEFLLLKELGDDRWQCLSKPGKKAKVGTEFFFGDELSLVVDEVDEEGLRYVTLKYDGILYEILDRLGTILHIFMKNLKTKRCIKRSMQRIRVVRLHRQQDSTSRMSFWKN